MTKVEQVARAIATAGWKVNGDERFNADDAYDLTNNSGRFAFDEMARAAIQAMRGPTDKMKESGSFTGWSDGTGAISEVEAVEVWHDMIDAALSQTSEES